MSLGGNNLISVIVPVYQCEEYLSRCLDSILNQTYSMLEIILIDDGSTDQSSAICDEYGKHDKRVKVIHQRNKGVSAARNQGLDIACGDYITFVDSDEYIEPEMYEQMLEKANRFSCDVVMCDCVKDFSDHSSIYTHSIRGGYYDYEQLKNEYYPHLLMMEDVEYPATISNCLMLFKSEICNTRYIEGVRFSEDLLFGAQLMYNARSFYYMKGETYYHYVMNDNSATHQFTKDKWNDYLILYDEAKRYFLQIEEFSFRNQLDLMLLFLVYNSVGNICGTKCLPLNQRKLLINNVLHDPLVIKMFKNLSICSLPISWKSKIYTYLLKYRFVSVYLLAKSI